MIFTQLDRLIFVISVISSFGDWYVFSGIEFFPYLWCYEHELNFVRLRNDFVPSLLNIRVRPYEIKYFEIDVHNPYHEDVIELNPGLPFFFKLEDV